MSCCYGNQTPPPHQDEVLERVAALESDITFLKSDTTLIKSYLKQVQWNNGHLRAIMGHFSFVMGRNDKLTHENLNCKLL